MHMQTANNALRGQVEHLQFLEYGKVKGFSHFPNGMIMPISHVMSDGVVPGPDYET